ncbi:MAG: histidine--tRNA ligase [Bacteroidia bacterium]
MAVSGFRDFFGQTLIHRNYLLGCLRSVFERFGYQPLETPALEPLSILEGKYGQEGDKLLFRILNSGDFWQNIPPDIPHTSQKLRPYLTEKGLRYDLTVPMARFVKENPHLLFPFKRYQIQPVWRADRPQKGRYREFYQCDADILGSTPPLGEIEILMLADEVFSLFPLSPVEIHLNHRGLLEGLAHLAGWHEDFSTFCGLLDKVDKVGWEKIAPQLQRTSPLPPILEKGFWQELHELPSTDLPTYQVALQEIQELQSYLATNPLQSLTLRWNIRLARGLDYYTGLVYEIIHPGTSVGTLAAGGRYDYLLKNLGGKNTSGIGISFGVERLYGLLEETTFFAHVEENDVWLIAWTDKSVLPYAYAVQKTLHAQDQKAFVYPAEKKLPKQLEYAAKRGFSHVVIVGPAEKENRQYQLKNLHSGEQKTCNLP